MKRRRQAAEREPVRRMLLPALMTLALASSAWAQTPQDAPRDPTAIKADLERIKADLEAVGVLWPRTYPVSFSSR